MLKVANIIEEGRWGGPQKRISLVAERLQKFGVETVVILPARDSDVFRSNLDDRGVDYAVLNLHRLSKSLGAVIVYLFTFLPDLYRLHRELKSQQVRLVHVSGGAWQVKGALAGFIAGIPVIWHLNDSSMPAVMVRLFRVLGRHADAFFVSAKRTFEYYLQHDVFQNHRWFLIEAPVDTVSYDPEAIFPDISIARYPFPRILIVSNVNPVKGFEVLLGAAIELKRKLPEFTVLIAGAKLETQLEYFDKLCDLVQKHELGKHVIFLGSKNNIPEIMKAANIYVCSSHAESSPMAVWEAMSMGMPVVSTDVGDVSLHINSGENGFVVDAGDAQAIAQKIMLLVEDEELRRKMGANARESALHDLDLEIISRRTAEAYTQIAC